MNIKVMIVDDHALVRMGMKRLLEDQPDIAVVAEAESGEQALKLIRTTMVDVVLLDMRMPGIDGLEVTRRLSRGTNTAKVVAVTAFADQPFPSRTLQAGALGYLTKECGVTEMLTAIRKVHQGHRYLSPAVAQAMALQSLQDKTDIERPFDKLSERELQVTLMIAQGLSVQEIADHLCISSKTVCGYRYRVFSKFSVKNDVGLTHLAIKYGLIDKPPPLGVGDEALADEH